MLGALVFEQVVQQQRQKIPSWILIGFLSAVLPGHWQDKSVTFAPKSKPFCFCCVKNFLKVRLKPPLLAISEMPAVKKKQDSARVRIFELLA
jgi:hypothetical protein